MSGFKGVEVWYVMIMIRFLFLAPALQASLVVAKKEIMFSNLIRSIILSNVRKQGILALTTVLLNRILVNLPLCSCLRIGYRLHQESESNTIRI